ncbi:tetratricopeptide repeat protein [Roseofilum casamattae]|uniref:Tetratricopeptide repeat protein n=1 Tax=Roseofilum casamattae BLCC-M143 TaxID=3022442 RepID=A0ABT7BV56_9CYAN|nr:tetratricopeptide repeat protein [Roseofilum casamattae]MDJ1182389.1 tetratricopeptide repeat protein [Roseofilum casamattae BLCC-M143]
MKAEAFLDWEEEELEPETAEQVWQRLIRGIRRNKGAGWFFVQCSPARQKETIERLQHSFRKDKVAILELNRESTTLYSEAKAKYEQENCTVLVVRGIEQALFAYEDVKRSLGWDDARAWNYSLQDVPPILNHLNQTRENLWEALPCAIVFVMRLFAVRYFMLRAPDFYDWRVGLLFVVPDSAYDKQTMIERGRYNEYCQLSAVERFKRIAQLHEIIGQPNLSVIEKVDLLIEQGRLFASGGDYLIALSWYDKAIELQPHYSRAWKNRGINLSLLERYEEAIFSFDKAIKFRPGYSRAWRNRGMALDKLGRYEEAIYSYKHAIELQPYSSTTWGHYGNTLLEVGQYKQAIYSFDRAIELQPDDSIAWNNRGNALSDLGKYEEAIYSFDRAIELQPDDSTAWYNRGNTLGYLGRYEEAIYSFNKALELQPDDFTAWNNCGYTLHELGRYKEALYSFYRAIELQPDYLPAWNNRGNALSNLGKYEEAIFSYERAIELQPDFSIAWHNRGNALSNLERYEEAISSYDRAIELQPDYSDAWNDRSTALEKLKQHCDQ